MKRGWLFLYDLNGLKEINDKSGHCGGDCALKDIASVIVESFGKECLYRVGGDEHFCYERMITSLQKVILFQNPFYVCIDV